VKYSRFEVLALVLGSAAIVASIFMAPSVSPQATEVAGQLLLILVLAGALHWGRNGGFLAALVAMAVYVAMRFALLESQGLSDDLLTMLGTRCLTYAVIGVVGGELASRIKYLFARLENDSLIDHTTGVYSARYAASAIVSGVGQWDRYRTEFSVVRIAIAPRVFAETKPARTRQLLKDVANCMRNDIRLVDDLACEPSGVFLAMLPGTDSAGASVVSKRLTDGIAQLGGIPADAIITTVLSASSNAQALKSLAEVLVPNAIPAEATPDLS
jgi:hypothetical protein